MLSSVLPTPGREYVVFKDAEKKKPKKTSVAPAVPAYGERQGYVPRSLADYGDGGAFPEIHKLQYPLNMGRKGEGKTTAVVPLEVDAKTGEVKYDAIVKQGENRKKTVYTSLEDAREKKATSEEALALPTPEDEAETARKTQAALGAIVDAKIKSARPAYAAIEGAATGGRSNKSTYVRYKPNPDAPGAQHQQRIVKMVEQQVDPLEPPKHKHSKVPRGPPSPPAPVLHSPPRKVTAADQQSWKIPPCISNYKNARGYTIPLDKRLAADGRGLQEQTVNNNFATLAEALYIAEKTARDEVRARAQIRQHNALQEKEAQEARLRELAAQARAERGAVIADRPQGGDPLPPLPEERYGEEGHYGPASSSRPRDTPDQQARSNDEDDEERRGRMEREEARIQRKRERERQMRLDNAKGDMKRSRLERERERDVSEKIALGLLKGTTKLKGEAQFDKRLFNQSAGLDSGHGQEDDYNVYSKPLVDREDANAIYRPRNNDKNAKYGDGDEQYAALTSKSKFAPADRAFAGTEGAKAQTRDGPVQFERSGAVPKREITADQPPDDEENDPFGLDQFLTDVKNKTKSST